LSLALHIERRSRRKSRPHGHALVQPQVLSAPPQAKTLQYSEVPINRAHHQQQDAKQIEQHIKPRRWDKPFGHSPIPTQLIEHLLSLPAFVEIESREFPEDLALADIIANDGRIVKYTRGDIIYSKGDYDNALYIVLRGSVRSLLTQQGEYAATRPRKSSRKLRNPSEIVTACLDAFQQLPSRALDRLSSYVGNFKQRFNQFSDDKMPPLHIEDVDELAIKFPTSSMAQGQVFGEFETLTRTPRGNTVFADTEETLLFELRWPGVRDIRSWSKAFRAHIDELYRKRGLETGLRGCSLFENIDEKTLETITRHCRFETHGDFSWAHRYQREMAREHGIEQIIDHEPIITHQGDYLDDLLVIRAGLARVSEKYGEGERTTGFLNAGEVFGLSEMLSSLDGDTSRTVQHSLRAMGYVDLIRIPAHVLEKHLPQATRAKLKAGLSDKPMPRIASPLAKDAGLPQSMLDFVIDNRFVNGTKAMAINTDRCVNCDDCVRACAATHDNIPRFVRQGTSHQNLMIANACMHCTDPVCLIDCPTNAIHRDIVSGVVVIDDATCIGCGGCATACPYNNIRMEEVKDAGNEFLVDEEGAKVLRATKCDLCIGQRNGPACQQACPHDALLRIDFHDTDKLSDWLKLAP